jgi:hypothetical protein
VWRRRWHRIVSLAGALLCLTACRSPATRFADEAAALGLRAEIVEGSAFRHVVLRRPRPAGARLNVYLDHDGTPWLGQTPAADPTPRDTLTLRLLALDTAPALYLGRPCYLGLRTDPECAPEFWTSARYSERVVASMAAALGRVVTSGGISQVAFFGYSGGGTLALLLAARTPQTVAVVTVAANLDVDAWADHHGWPRLTGSLNPARVAHPGGILRWHYAGARDTVVPAELIRRAAPAGDRVVIIAGYDHVCCWAELWPSVLEDVDRQLRHRGGAPPAGG